MGRGGLGKIGCGGQMELWFLGLLLSRLQMLHGGGVFWLQSAFPIYCDIVPDLGAQSHGPPPGAGIREVFLGPIVHYIV